MASEYNPDGSKRLHGRRYADNDENERLTEDEWDERYEWLATDMDGNCTLLSNSNTPPAVRKLLALADPHHVWSQIDSDDGGYEIVPGLQRQAIGWYITEKPWATGKERILRPEETEDGAD